MDEYTLYLDESTNADGTCFAVSGIITKNDMISKLNSNILDAKKCIWSEEYISQQHPILHCVELTTVRNCMWNRKNLALYIKQHPHYSSFQSMENKIIKDTYNNVYSRICKTLKEIDGVTIGCSVDINKFKYLYGDKFHIDSELFFEVAMQETIENYAHFLYTNNAIGSIVYESRSNKNEKTNRSADFKMYNNFCKIKSSNKGISFINQDMLSKTIRYLNIFKKSDDIAGLQLADFIAYNTTSAKSFFDGNNKTEFQNKIINRLYNGAVELSEKDLRPYFGMKYLPYDFEYLTKTENECSKLKKSLESIKCEKNRLLKMNTNLYNEKNRLIEENKNLKAQNKELSQNSIKQNE